MSLILFTVGGLYLWMSLKPVKKVLYFSEEEHQGQEFTIRKTTPAHLVSKPVKKDTYRFIRFRDSYNFQLGWKSVTRWLAKKGTAYSKNLEGGEVGPFTLFKVMNVVWGTEVIEALKDELKQQLIESEVMITVKLEEGMTPSEHTDRSELYIKKEADEEMARLFGENIRKEFAREDWIRTAALLGCGVALAYVAQAMGLLAGVA